MRKLQGLVCSLILLTGISSLSAEVIPGNVTTAIHTMTMSAVTNLDWKVGDTLNFDLRIKPIPVVAAAVLKVTQIDKDGITLVEEISYKTLKQTIETVLDPNTGQVKSTKINGKPVAMPAPSGGSGSKIIKEEEAHIKVKAGEFDCIHIVMESQAAGQEEPTQTEIWMNPAAIPISGMLKTSSVVSYFTIEMELASFVHGH